MKMIALILLGTFGLSAHGWTVLSPSLLGWNRNPVVLSVNYANCPITQEELNLAIDTAIELWNSIPGSNLELSRTTSATTVNDFLTDVATDTPVILCDPNLSASLGVSANFIPGATMRIQGTGSIEYGGILLNAEAANFSYISNLTPLELQITLAHELGHVLGLGHTSDAAALMYYSIGDKTEVLIGEDDRDGIRYLYPSIDFAQNCAGVPHFRKGRGTPWYFLSLMLLVFSLPFLRRRLLRIHSASSLCSGR